MRAKYPDRPDVRRLEHTRDVEACHRYGLDQGDRIIITYSRMTQLVGVGETIRGYWQLFFWGINYSSFQLRVITTGSLIMASGRTFDGDNERDREAAGLWSSV